MPLSSSRTTVLSVTSKRGNLQNGSGGIASHGGALSRKDGLGSISRLMQQLAWLICIVHGLVFLQLKQ